jgi:glycosyltransferase involved in cell wall biosynthesis
MDRAEHLHRVLPSLLGQDYPAYAVHVVDNSSTDGVESVIEEFRCDRLRLLCRPRPRHFSLASTRNCGIRFSFSDLCFFMDSDMSFADCGHLSRLVSQFQHDECVDYEWFARWRRDCGYAELPSRRSAAELASTRDVYSHCLGSPLLVDRRVIQAIGGYNEALTDWGYEDTDLCGRLELSGLGRIEMEPVLHLAHDPQFRVANYEAKDPAVSWQRNRQCSDRSIMASGVVSSSTRRPGHSAWIEIDGTRWPGARAPQQDWTMTGAPRREIAAARPGLDQLRRFWTRTPRAPYVPGHDLPRL